MAKTDLKKLTDDQKCKLIENRWASSDTVWDIIQKTYRQNTNIYENKAGWLENISFRRRNWIVQANRIFVNMEAVINSLIANPPGINVLPGRKGTEAQEFAASLEKYFRKKYEDRNIKETVRKGLRNLYFGRLLVIKPFWNPTLGNGGDFDFSARDPRMVRVGKYAAKEQDSEFAIEEIEDNLCSVIERFPSKKKELMAKFGFPETPDGEAQLYIKNPTVKYKEAWITNDYVLFKLENIILGEIDNPYWDYDGILVTQDEQERLKEANSQTRRQILTTAKLDQNNRKMQMQAPEPQMPVQSDLNAPDMPENQASEQAGEMGETPETQEPVDPKYHPYLFNYFDAPRKPYIIATIFNNENSPIGRTDMITLSADLQRGIDKRKMDIDENCELVNGILKVDSGVMGKSDAQRIRFETKGVIWGKGVKDGVTRETGAALPDMVFRDMEDSRAEIDNIMAATSAFRGERQGQETKAGRLALIQQSFLRLNELVQVTDYVHKEIFDWGMQLGKTRYTEYHYAKWMGKDSAQETVELIQDDFEEGIEVVVVPGKSLPVDDEFKFEQAQNDFKQGALGLTDYLRIAKYDDPKETAKNAVTWQVNKPVAVGMSQEEIQKIAPEQKEEKPPNVTINYKDMPPDAQVQLLGQIGIQADEELMFAEKMAEHKKGDKELDIKRQASIKVEPQKQE